MRGKNEDLHILLLQTLAWISCCISSLLHRSSPDPKHAKNSRAWEKNELWNVRSLRVPLTCLVRCEVMLKTLYYLKMPISIIQISWELETKSWKCKTIRTKTSHNSLKLTIAEEIWGQLQNTAHSLQSNPNHYPNPNVRKQDLDSSLAAVW